MLTTIPVTKARADLLQLVDFVDQNYTRIDLTKRGKVKAALVSPDYLDSLEETQYTLANSLRDIELSEKEIRQGKGIELEQLKKKMKHVG